MPKAAVKRKNKIMEDVLYFVAAAADVYVYFSFVLILNAMKLTRVSKANNAIFFQPPVTAFF